MRRIQYHRYGNVDEMKLETFEVAELRPDEVSLKVRFAAINPVDWKIRNGDLKIVTGRKFPRGMGCDFSSEVVAVGANVADFSPGDPVFGLTHVKTSGALADVVVTPQNFLARKPDPLSFEQAATLGTPGVTAWNGLIDKARLKAGQHVLINGCAGAVGTAAVQIALMHGAIVSGTCSAGSAARARAMGVTEVLDYRTTDLATFLKRFDVVFDTAGTMSVATGIGLLNRGGVYLDIDPAPAKFIRSFFDRRLKPIICTTRPDILTALATAATSGTLSMPIAEIIDLDVAIGKIADLERGAKVPGKTIVAIG